MACDAEARTPRCMLSLEIIEGGMGLCCRARRRTPTLNSPLSPLQISGCNSNYNKQNALIAKAESHNLTDKEAKITSRKRKHRLQLIS